MEGLTYEPQTTYQLQAYGTLGEFSSAAGPLAFLLTKARLGAAIASDEQRLASKLAPFREVIPGHELKFAELLQRDIDDHRVARQLIPYLMTPRPEGPAAFPPILCMLLPFENRRPIEKFPDPTDLELAQDPTQLYFTGRRWGDAFQIQDLRTPTGGAFPMSVGRLSWNSERTQLVVLDGQHRAMALLAIHRTVTDTWEDGPGQRYRVFYEHTVRELLQQHGRFQIEAVEVPVALCWFPEASQNVQPHQSARQLFVDVNREARGPSPSRSTLLSESELESIFARHILDKLREQPAEQELPLPAIEFDNPSSETFRPVKWSVLTNLELIKHAVKRCVRGPRRVIEDATAEFARGQQGALEMDRFMRDQLELVDELAEFIEDGDGRVIPRDEIGNTNFPRSELDKLLGLFWRSWGRAIVAFLRDVEPYRAHAEALRQLKARWNPDDQAGGLAYDAIFEGVGFFFTLRSEYQGWVSRGRDPADRSEVASAWMMLDERQKEFEQLRAAAFLRSAGDDAVTDAKKLYRTFNTHACQLGGVMAIATLAWNLDTARDEVAALADRMIAGWNAAFEDGARRDFLDKDADRPLNQIREMNTPRAPLFRYFWLELLATPEGRVHLELHERGELDSLRDDARFAYLQYLYEQERNLLERAEPDLPPLRRDARARNNATERLAAALEHWMGVDREAFDRWHEAERIDEEEENAAGEEDASEDELDDEPEQDDA